MSANPFPGLSLELAHAHRLAARELVKYCEDFARWRNTKEGCLSVLSLPKQPVLLPHPMRKPHLPEPDRAA